MFFYYCLFYQNEYIALKIIRNEILNKNIFLTTLLDFTHNGNMKMQNKKTLTVKMLGNFIKILRIIKKGF